MIRKLKLGARWRWFLPLSLLVALVLRLVWLEDMEWKEDEHYNFIVTQLIGRTDPWPWFGMPSGVYIPNPGMSVWAFVWLARLTGVETPIGLMRALALLAVLGIAGIMAFALTHLKSEKEREPWLWGACIAAVNPLIVSVHRKLWPEPFFAFLTPIVITAWWHRRKLGGAFAWGAIGAILGQVHMSGFFFSAALALWTALSAERREVHWRGWFAGSTLAALPLLPWIQHVRTHPAAYPATSGWAEAVQLKFWVFWISDPFGLHLGNLLGLNLGPRHFDQLSDFARWPLLGSFPTYFVGVAHVLLVFLLLMLLAWAGRAAWQWLRKNRRSLSWTKVRAQALPESDPTGLLISSSLIGFGGLMTLIGLRIRRYYMMVSFPLEGVWMARWFLTRPVIGRRILMIIWSLELLISASFLIYVHWNGGSPAGDYGPSFSRVVEQHIRLQGRPWPPRPPMLPLQEPPR